jgi:hypothetical protein
MRLKLARMSAGMADRSAATFSSRNSTVHVIPIDIKNDIMRQPGFPAQLPAQPNACFLHVPCSMRATGQIEPAHSAEPIVPRPDTSGAPPRAAGRQGWPKVTAQSARSVLDRASTPSAFTFLAAGLTPETI